MARDLWRQGQKPPVRIVEIVETKSTTPTWNQILIKTSNRHARYITAATEHETLRWMVIRWLIVTEEVLRHAKNSMICLINDRLRDALNCQTFDTTDRSSYYVERVGGTVAELAKHLFVKAESQGSGLVPPTIHNRYPICFWTRLWHEWRARSSHPVFISLLHNAPQGSCIKYLDCPTTQRQNGQNVGTETLYCEVISYILKTHATCRVVG